MPQRRYNNIKCKSREIDTVEVQLVMEETDVLFDKCYAKLIASVEDRLPIR